jgi:RNA-directed DNA polymerase
VKREFENSDIPKPPPVSERAKPGGEGWENQRGTLVLSPNSMELWTNPMLAALERGNDGRQWHSLIDKVWSQKALRLGLETVTARKGAAGVDKRSCELVKARAEEEIALLHRRLREGSYEPQPARRVWIEKAGSKDQRPLGIPTVRDRIVESALLYILEPIFERDFAEGSYGFRPGRRAQQAIEVVEEKLAEGYGWVVDADLKGYFDSIPQDKLIARVREKIADGAVLGLLEKFLKRGVMETAKGWKPTTEGTPQGAVISPLLANVYLDPLDREMERRGRVMVRYADDFVILCRSKKEAQEALEEVRQWVETNGLELHPQKTRLVSVEAGEGFEFLGWHYERGYKWPREKSIQKFKDAIRKKTKRNNGRSLWEITRSIRSVIVGWGRYFSGGSRRVPERLDRWIRKRLRSILRRRDKRDGPGRGRDHNRYTNAWLAARGWISLLEITHGAAAGPARKGRTVASCRQR